jgi:hypothetical protein
MLYSCCGLTFCGFAGVSVWKRCCAVYVTCGHLQAGDTTVLVCFSNALLCMLLVCVRSYLKSVLTITVYFEHLSSGHSTFTRAKMWESVVTFRRQKGSASRTFWETFCTVELDMEWRDPHWIENYSRCLNMYCHNSESRPELYFIYFYSYFILKRVMTCI